MDTEQTLDFNLLPAFCQARVLVLGVGNVLFGDDGFGPVVVESLLQDYDIPDDVYVMDVGTGVRKLLFTLILGDTLPEEIVIVDAVDWGYSIGDVQEISADELPVTKIDDFSLHQVPTSNMLRELQDHSQVKVSVIVCDIGNLPQKIDPGLSPKIRQAVQSAAEKIATRFSLEPL
ncbi:MAG: hydrogenase maturation protease [Anaerolineales bacterium]|jgi:coenzyme F420 hydrogenase subunit delta|nr:hydrogenase maturation protease [Anaerolineales bacterium]